MTYTTNFILKPEPTCRCGSGIGIGYNPRNQKCPKCTISDKVAKLKYRYNLTIDQYNDLILTQHNRCAICNIFFDGETRNTTVHVDHDHNSNKVRGLLCNTCNVTIGSAKEDITILLNAITYLTHFKENNV